jgi:hypothetical protein
MEESALRRRVREWDERLRPVLQAEEAREPFDMHIYGGRVLAHFPHPEPAATPEHAAAGGAPLEKDHGVHAELGFSDLVGPVPEYEVCRLFLATLQLVLPWSWWCWVGL